MVKYYMKQKKDSKIYQDWFDKADHDLNAAKILFNEGGFMDTIGYHLHQAIEKYLKGFLLFYKQEYSLTHDLIKLLKECFKFDKNITDYYEECERMNAYYIEAKYPMDAPQNYSKNEMQKSIEMTRFLLKYIKKQIK